MTENIIDDQLMNKDFKIYYDNNEANKIFRDSLVECLLLIRKISLSYEKLYPMLTYCPEHDRYDIGLKIFDHNTIREIYSSVFAGYTLEPRNIGSVWFMVWLKFEPRRGEDPLHNEVDIPSIPLHNEVDIPNIFLMNMKNLTIASLWMPGKNHFTGYIPKFFSLPQVDRQSNSDYYWLDIDTRDAVMVSFAIHYVKSILKVLKTKSPAELL